MSFLLHTIKKTINHRFDNSLIRVLVLWMVDVGLCPILLAGSFWTLAQILRCFPSRGEKIVSQKTTKTQNLGLLPDMPSWERFQKWVYTNLVCLCEIFHGTYIAKIERCLFYFNYFSPPRSVFIKFCKLFSKQFMNKFRIMILYKTTTCTKKIWHKFIKSLNESIFHFHSEGKSKYKNIFYF